MHFNVGKCIVIRLYFKDDYKRRITYASFSILKESIYKKYSMHHSNQSSVCFSPPKKPPFMFSPEISIICTACFNVVTVTLVRNY